MGAVTETDVSLLESLRTEWASLRVKRQNVLIEGSCRATNAALSVLQPQMPESVVWSPTRAFDLPSGDVRTLILKNVAGLSAANQTRLLAWIGGDGSGTQIISTNEHPLFTAVTRGVFEKALYYRLNVMLLRVEPGKVARARA
jgi:Sigma-54 interaction domain